MEPLNIDWTQDDIEERLEQLKNSIITKLTDGFGYQLQDDTLSTWIILIAVRQNKTKDEIQQDLVEFIGENSPDFVEWLWLEAPKLWTIPKIESKVVKVQNEEKRHENSAKTINLSKKDQHAASNTSTHQASSIKNKNEEQKQNDKFESKSNYKANEKVNSNDKSQRLIKKAIGDATKFTAKGGDKYFTKEKSGSSYVTTNKEGRKIIHLNKPKYENKVEEQTRKYGNREHEHKPTGKADVFQRLKPKAKDEGKKSSNLDLDLDSVIKQQKEHDYGHNSRNWNQGGKKRNFYEVTEENYENKSFKRQKHSENYEIEEDEGAKHHPKYSNTGAAEGEGGEGDKEAPTRGYKGKKKNPFYGSGMPFVQPGAMYGYGYNPMYAMDPYMMGGYYPPVGGFKKFKNKSLIINKSSKPKAKPVQKPEEEAGK